MSKARVMEHTEPLGQVMKLGIAIGGEGVVDGGETRILFKYFKNRDRADLSNLFNAKTTMVLARAISKHCVN